MMKKLSLVGLLALLLTLPMTTWAINIPAKVFENGPDNNPAVVSGVSVEVLGGFGFKGPIFSALTGEDGSCLLANVPLGKNVIVKLSKAGYITQYDVRSYSETDAQNGVILWIGSEVNVTASYKNLGEEFSPTKGHLYLEINDGMTGEGIDGIQLGVSSGKVFYVGNGEYLIANANGTSLKIVIQKPGYDFDIQSIAVPLYPGAITQAYVDVQTDGAVYESGNATRVTSATISGHILRLSDSVPIAGVTVAFTSRGVTVRPPVVTDKNGLYKQTEFPVNKSLKVTPSKPPFKFTFGCKSSQKAKCPARVKTVIVPAKGAVVDYQAF
jgi:hypothetical protein